MHASFLWCAVGLARVAVYARADNVLPGRRTAAISRNHVVKIQIFPVASLAAELAGVLVALEDVMARELNLLLGQTIVNEQQNHPRHADAEGDRVDGFRMR